MAEVSLLSAESGLIAGSSLVGTGLIEDPIMESNRKRAHHTMLCTPLACIWVYIREQMNSAVLDCNMRTPAVFIVIIPWSTGQVPRVLSLIKMTRWVLPGYDYSKQYVATDLFAHGTFTFTSKTHFVQCTCDCGFTAQYKQWCTIVWLANNIMEQTIKWEKLLWLFIVYIPEFAELVSISDVLFTSAVVQRPSRTNQSTVQFSIKVVLTIFIMDILSRG